jgi:DNA-directed RNA polymerase specialized sigma24 family protein
LIQSETALLPHLNDLYRTVIRLTAGDGAKAERIVESAFSAVLRDRSWRSTPRIALFRAAIQLTRKSTVSRPEVGTRDAPDVLAAVDALPLDLREAVLLVDCMDFRCRDACYALDLASDLLTARLGQARRRIQESVGRESGMADNRISARCMGDCAGLGNA